MAISFQLILWLIVLFILNFYFLNKKKYENTLILLFGLLLIVPPDAVGLISGYPYSSGGRINISIVGYDVLLLLICILTRSHGKLRRVKSKMVIILLGGVLFLFFLRLVINGTDSLSNKMLDNYLLPSILALIIMNILPVSKIDKVFDGILFFVMINAAICATEVVIGRSLLFHSYYMENVSWYSGLYGVQVWGIPMRGTAMLGHPLVNGMYYLICLPYVFYKKFHGKKIRKIICFAILTGGILASNSRGALFLAIGYLAFTILKKRNYFKMAAFVLITAIIIGMLDLSSIYYSLFSRDLTGGSFFYRFESLTKFLNVPFSTLLLGTGYNNTASTLKTIGLAGNFEISYLIILLENGIFGFIILIGIMMSMFRKDIKMVSEEYEYSSLIHGMMLCMLGLAVSGNYFGDPGTLNYMLWAIFAFSYTLGKTNKNYQIAKKNYSVRERKSI